MKELIIQHWQYIAGYFAMGWLLGVAMFRFVFMERDCSMGGNSGGQPLHYYKVALPSMPQAIVYVLGVLLWPFTLAALAIAGFLKLCDYIAESRNHVFPSIVKWVFGWPVLLALRLCNKCVDHDD